MKETFAQSMEYSQRVNQGTQLRIMLEFVMYMYTVIWQGYVTYMEVTGYEHMNTVSQNICQYACGRVNS